MMTKSGCSHEEHEMECCEKHYMSKEHLEMKKKILEEKLRWVEEKLKEVR